MRLRRRDIKAYLTGRGTTVSRDEFYQKMQDGHYKPKTGYPVKPYKPKLLSMKVEELTNGDLENIAMVKAKYNERMAEYEKLKDACYKEQNKVETQWFNDLMELAGVPKDHPFVVKLYNIAYERGHSAGHSEVAYWFFDLVELYELAKEHGMT